MAPDVRVGRGTSVMKGVTDEAIVACVPNFSEGVDEGCVRAIVAAMRVERRAPAGLVDGLRP